VGVDKAMKVCLDLHDFSVVNNRLDILLKLKEHFPGFKVSLFTVPIDQKVGWGRCVIRKELLKEVKKHLNWMQIIPHGLRHEASFEARTWGKTRLTSVLSSIEKVFDDDGLPFVRGFCAPHWRWSNIVVETLDKAGWWGAVDRDKKMPCTKIYYKYNYLLNESFWEAKGDLKLHGHIYGTRNDVGLCFDNLLKLPKSVEWCFVTDFLEKKDETV